MRRTVIVCLVFALMAVAAIVLIAVFFAFLRHWIAVHSGTTNESGEYYAFWSGFGADLGEGTLISAVALGVYTGARKVNCHEKGCWRIGHHPLDGTPYILCRHHHPDVPSGGATHEDILAHFERKRRQAAEAAVAAAGQGPATSSGDGNRGPSSVGGPAHPETGPAPPAT